MDSMLRVVAVVMVGGALCACADDVTSGGSGGASTGGGGSGAGGTGGGGQGGAGAGGAGNAGGQGGVGPTGCIDDPGRCPATWECCAGVPYPDDGQCYPECTMLSDRDVKHDVAAVDPDEVLERLASVPVARWRYDADPKAVHMGPMAQDFHAAFGLGSSERVIAPVDANGASFAAIQALHARVERLQRESKARARENEELRAELEALRARLERR
jgi:hypothetical protein